jgi:hypothetical protein
LDRSFIPLKTKSFCDLLRIILLTDGMFSGVYGTPDNFEWPDHRALKKAHGIGIVAARDWYRGGKGSASSRHGIGIGAARD